MVRRHGREGGGVVDCTGREGFDKGTGRRSRWWWCRRGRVLGQDIFGATAAGTFDEAFQPITTNTSPPKPELSKREEMLALSKSIANFVTVSYYNTHPTFMLSSQCLSLHIAQREREGEKRGSFVCGQPFHDFPWRHMS